MEIFAMERFDKKAIAKWKKEQGKSTLLTFMQVFNALKHLLVILGIEGRRYAALHSFPFAETHGTNPINEVELKRAITARGGG